MARTKLELEFNQIVQTSHSSLLVPRFVYFRSIVMIKGENCQVKMWYIFFLILSPQEIIYNYLGKTWKIVKWKMKTDSPQFFFKYGSIMLTYVWHHERKGISGLCMVKLRISPWGWRKYKSIHPSIRLSKDEHVCAKAASCMSVGGWVEIKGRKWSEQVVLWWKDRLIREWWLQQMAGKMAPSFLLFFFFFNYYSHTYYYYYFFFFCWRTSLPPPPLSPSSPRPPSLPDSITAAHQLSASLSS